MIPSFDHGVVVVGDVMLDRFVYGTSGRLSPEAPVPVVRKTRETMMAGGAGNVARNIEALGGRPTLFGLAGQDAAGDELARVIGAPARLVRSADWQTIVKLRVIAQHQQVVRIDEEEPRAATSAEATELLADLAQTLGRARAMILSDYGKGVLTPEVCA
ncbi:MAG: PfkB family carbohydrate kinase, partial [Gemmobacter sp.]